MPSAARVKEVFAELYEQPIVTIEMLNMLSAWMTATAASRPNFGCNDDTWEDDVDLAGVAGYIALQQNKLEEGGAWDPVLTIMDVEAFAARSENRDYLHLVHACLERNLAFPELTGWKLMVAGSHDDMTNLCDRINSMIP
jgi:hypothetical protein